jgi:SAM-dependent methyltransferase
VGTERRALSEIARVLEPGGHLVLSTPSRTLRSRLLDPAYFLTGHRHYGCAELSEMLAEVGFETERCEVLGSWVYVADYLAFYFYKYVMRRPMPRPEGFIAAFIQDTLSKGFATVYLLARTTGGGVRVPLEKATLDDGRFKDAVGRFRLIADELVGDDP